MERRNRRKRILLIAIIAILMAVFIVAYVSFISSDSNTHITLPPQDISDAFDSTEQTADFAGITKSNVQQVIAQMDRADTYQRTMTIITSWSGGSSSEKTEMIVSDELVRLNITRGDETRCTVINGEECFIWYAGETKYITRPTGDFTQFQQSRIPDYTDILALESHRISDAALEEKEGIMCIRVDFKTDVANCVYWLDLDSGLLYAAEEYENGKPVYNMTVDSMEAPVSSDETLISAFTLPDGRVLYQ
ncbi:MAG: hypothetical protein IJP23_04300 [Oscillospiraceae bacterium]|nr:hypothetical protein [Oscillospiraceae bacterium]